MSKLMLKCSALALAGVFIAATIDVAEAGGNKRGQRGSSQMMRLGGPTNGVTTNRNGATTNRDDIGNGSSDGSLRTNAQVERFFQRHRDNSGPG